jgi:hypothetical protein
MIDVYAHEKLEAILAELKGIREDLNKVPEETALEDLQKKHNKQMKANKDTPKNEPVAE